MDKSHPLSFARFGRWTVLEDQSNAKKRHVFCKCDCGTERQVSISNLKSGGSVSCGCYKREVTSEVSRTHGMSKTRTYKIWKGIIKRCHNESSSGYHKYGGKGISVCSTWRESFESFLKDMGECPDGMSIDRIDVFGNYEPSNCRWATTIEQSYNRTNTVYFDGKTLLEWEIETGIKRGTLKRRLLKTGTIWCDAPNSIKPRR